MLRLRAAALSELARRRPRSAGALAPSLAAIALACGPSEPSAEERLVWAPIDELGIEARVSADALIAPLSESAGFPTATIGESPKIFVLGENEVFWRADLAASKAWIVRDPNRFQSFSRQEASADEFHLEYSFASLLDGAPIYGLTIRRRIGGQLFDCNGRSRIEAERAAMIAICESLRPGDSKGEADPRVH